MLTVEEFKSLQLHDAVETHPMMPGVSDEPVVLRVVEVSENEVVFVSTYFGVTLGRWTCKLNGQNLDWMMK